MTNKYGIPDELEAKIRAKYKLCIYCRKEMKDLPKAKGTPTDKATIEHFDDYSVSHPAESNIAMCCGSCNASRGPKKLQAWFESEYCKINNINKDTIADIVKMWLEGNMPKDITKLPEKENDYRVSLSNKKKEE